MELSSEKAWRAWSKVPGNRPADVPSDPRKVYKDAGWTNWGGFLGTGNIECNKMNFRSFDTCRVYARSLQLSGETAWKAWSKVPGNRPDDVPSNPYSTGCDVQARGHLDELGRFPRYRQQDREQKK